MAFEPSDPRDQILWPASSRTTFFLPRINYLNCFSLHMNWISPSSSGSPHFNSTVEQSTTSGSRNKPRASLYSQSSGEGCFCKEATPGEEWPPPPSSSSSCRSGPPPPPSWTYVGVNIFEDLLDGAVLFNQIDGSFGADALDGPTVVTAQEDTQVYELRGNNNRETKVTQGLTTSSASSAKGGRGNLHLFFTQADILQDPREVEFLDGKFSKTNNPPFILINNECSIP